jgi:hypothetical protein
VYVIAEIVELLRPHEPIMLGLDLPAAWPATIVQTSLVHHATSRSRTRNTTVRRWWRSAPHSGPWSRITERRTRAMIGVQVQRQFMRDPFRGWCGWRR